MIASPIQKAASDDLDSTATNRGLAAICPLKVKLECTVSDTRVSTRSTLFRYIAGVTRVRCGLSGTTILYLPVRSPQ